MFSSFGFISHVNHVTRPICESCLDHFLLKTTKYKEFLTSVIFAEQITDHNTTSFLFNIDNISYTEEQESKRQFLKTP